VLFSSMRVINRLLVRMNTKSSVTGQELCDYLIQRGETQETLTVKNFNLFPCPYGAIWTTPTREVPPWGFPPW